MSAVAGAGLSLALLVVLAFGVVAPPEHCPPARPGELRASAQAAVDWFARNQNPDGSWLYEYNADSDTVSAPAEYNWVRHAGATMGLYQAAAAGMPRALRSADRGTEWALARLIERDRWSAFGSPTQVSTGASALLAAGLEIRREATGDKRYDRELMRLGRFLVNQTEPSGAVLASYDPLNDVPVAGDYSKYFTGETYWALSRLQRGFPGAGWGQTADRIGTYLATRRDEAEDHWPPIPDHWAAYGMAETASLRDRPLTDEELALRAQAGGAVRSAGALARTAVRAVGRARAGRLRAARRLVRRGRRGAHGLVARRPGRPAVREPERSDREPRRLHRRTRRERSVRCGRRGRGDTPRTGPGSVVP